MKTVSTILFSSLVFAGACGGDGGDPCAEPGAVCRWAGIGERGYNNLNPDADRRESKLYAPMDLTFGPDGRAVIADWNNHRIRRVELDGRMTSIIGTDYEGDGAPDKSDLLPKGSAPGAPGSLIAMNHPSDLEFGPDGKMYVGAWHNNKVWTYDPATENTVTLTGDTYGFSGDGGPCYMAALNQPKSIVIAQDGTLYTNDQRNVRIRKVTPDGIIHTISGTGVIGNTGDGGDMALATWGMDTGTTPRPSGGLVLADNDRTMYVADSRNNRIRKIDLTTGMVTAFAGDPAGAPGFVDGDGAAARFDYPLDIEIGPEGHLYVADRYNNVIRAIDPVTGAVRTVAGNGLRCASLNDCGATDNVDGLAPLDVQLNEPYGLAFDVDGNLFIADTHNHRILKVTR